eukprot:618864-Pleurochrysis_carterae.AAC.2
MPLQIALYGKDTDSEVQERGFQLERCVQTTPASGSALADMYTRGPTYRQRRTHASKPTSRRPQIKCRVQFPTTKLTYKTQKQRQVGEDGRERAGPRAAPTEDARDDAARGADVVAADLRPVTQRASEAIGRGARPYEC